MSTTDTERYVRVTLLTFEGGTWISKEILLREVAKIAGSPTLANLLGDKKDEIDRKRSRMQITKRQYETLFPISGENTNIDEWDLSLLIKTVLFLFEPSLANHERYDLSEILRIRNEVVCHAKQSSLKEQDYNIHWSALTVSICGLAFDENTKEHASDLVNKLSGARLDLQSSIDKLTQLCKNDEIVLEKLEQQKDKLNAVATGIVDANSKLDEVLSGVNELKRRHEEDEEDRWQRKIPILENNVCISGTNEDEVNLSENIILTVMRAGICKAEDPYDNRNVRIAVKQCLEDLKRNGGHTESAERGSIILKIRCNTLKDLETFLSLFLSSGQRFRLTKIENALNALLDDGVKVELVLPDDTIDMLRGWIDLCLPEGLSDTTEDQVHGYKRTIKLGIRCDSAEAAVDVIRYLQSSDSANRMNQIAEAVSEVVHNQIKIEATPDVEGFAQALSQGKMRVQSCASNTESEMDSLVYSDYTGPVRTPSQPSAELTNELPDQLQQDMHPERPPKPTTTSATRHQQVHLTSKGCDSSGSMVPDDEHVYDYIETGDITIGPADDKIVISHMHALSRGDIVLYDESKKQLVLYDAELTTCRSSHQMPSRMLDMCIVRLGTEDRIYVVLHGACSKSSEIIHFVTDNARSVFQTKGSITMGYKSSGLTGYDRGIAVLQNMTKGRILIHLYNKDYSQDIVWPIDFKISMTDMLLRSNRHGRDLRYSLSTAGRGKLVIIADCKYTFVSIVDVERGQLILKYDHASLACPLQVATYQDNIVFILCKESCNVHALAITGSADQRRELTNLHTLNLDEWSPGAICCCSAKDKLYISHSQIGRVRTFQLSDLKLQQC